MLGKISVVGGLVWLALQLTVTDSAMGTGAEIVAQAGKVKNMRCAQATQSGFTLDELRARGLTLDCN